MKYEEVLSEDPDDGGCMDCVHYRGKYLKELPKKQSLIDACHEMPETNTGIKYVQAICLDKNTEICIEWFKRNIDKEDNLDKLECCEQP